MLVVDDDGDARSLMTTVFRYHGALVTAVASATEALRRLERIQPDVVICDIAMPEHDGYWLVQEFARRFPARRRRTPVIALTAFGQEHSRERALAAGFDAHLRKPLDPHVAAATIRALLTRPP